MYIQLYEKLVIIQKAYENIQALGEQIYENLKNKDINAVQKLQVEQLQYIDGLKGLSSSFEEMVVQFCKEKDVEASRVSALFSYFSQEEIEKWKNYKNVTELEENVKMILFEKSILLKRTIKNYRKYCGFCF